MKSLIIYKPIIDHISGLIKIILGGKLDGRRPFKSHLQELPR